LTPFYPKTLPQSTPETKPASHVAEAAVVQKKIACCKMTLVILFFMHLKYSENLTKIIVVAAFFLVRYSAGTHAR
jgi:caa(3)-type oxidase subunit IV